MKQPKCPLTDEQTKKMRYIHTVKYYSVTKKGWIPFAATWTDLKITILSEVSLASLVAPTVNNPPAVHETWVHCLGWEDPLEEGMATHSSILAWRIPWAEEPEGLQSMELKRVGHDWATEHSTRPDPADRHPSSFLGGQSLWLWHLFPVCWIYFFWTALLYIFIVWGWSTF